MNMETNLIGISQTVTKELATLPAVPNVVIIVKARGRHEHAPADAPIMVPIMLEPILFVFFISLTRQTFIDMAIAESIDKMTMSEKLSSASGYTWKTKNGSRNKNSEIMINDKNNPMKIVNKIRMFRGFEYTSPKILVNLDQ